MKPALFKTGDLIFVSLDGLDYTARLALNLLTPTSGLFLSPLISVTGLILETIDRRAEGKGHHIEYRVLYTNKDGSYVATISQGRLARYIVLDKKLFVI